MSFFLTDSITAPPEAGYNLTQRCRTPYAGGKLPIGARVSDVVKHGTCATTLPVPATGDCKRPEQLPDERLARPAE